MHTVGNGTRALWVAPSRGPWYRYTNRKRTHSHAMNIQCASAVSESPVKPVGSRRMSCSNINKLHRCTLQQHWVSATPRRRAPLTLVSARTGDEGWMGYIHRSSFSETVVTHHPETSTANQHRWKCEAFTSE